MDLDEDDLHNQEERRAAQQAQELQAAAQQRNEDPEDGWSTATQIEHLKITQNFIQAISDAKLDEGRLDESVLARLAALKWKYFMCICLNAYIHWSFTSKL